MSELSPAAERLLRDLQNAGQSRIFQQSPASTCSETNKNPAQCAGFVVLLQEVGLEQTHF